MKTTNRRILVGLFFLAILMAGYDGVLYAHDLAPGAEAVRLWRFIFAVLVVLWVDNDSRDRQWGERCFDFQYFVFLFCPLYVPYYLMRTRGLIRGISALTGFLALYGLAFLVQWGIYLFEGV